jgi:hypothetical protein
VTETRWRTMAPWVTALILVVLVNAAFLMLGVSVATMPREPLVERVRQAFASGDLIENDWPWLESRRGSTSTMIARSCR